MAFYAICRGKQHNFFIRWQHAPSSHKQPLLFTFSLEIYYSSAHQNANTAILLFLYPCEFLASFGFDQLGHFCRVPYLSTQMSVPVACQIGLSNYKQFSHDTIKATSMFIFTLSLFFSVTTTAKLYLTLNSFTTHI